MLGQYHLKKSGKKQALIARLITFFQKVGTPYHYTPPFKTIRHKSSTSESRQSLSAADSALAVDGAAGSASAHAEQLMESEDSLSMFGHKYGANSQFNVVDTAAATDSLPAFIMPPPTCIDNSALSPHPTVVCTFEPEEESFRPAPGTSRVHVRNSTLQSHFDVFYQRTLWDAEGVCDHQVLLIAFSRLQLTLTQHRDLFVLTDSTAGHLASSRPPAECPRCGGACESWLWTSFPDSKCVGDNSLLRWLAQRLPVPDIIKPHFGPEPSAEPSATKTLKEWPAGCCRLLLCKLGHLSLSVLEPRPLSLSLAPHTPGLEPCVFKHSSMHSCTTGLPGAATAQPGSSSDGAGAGDGQRFVDSSNSSNCNPAEGKGGGATPHLPGGEAPREGTAAMSVSIALRYRPPSPPPFSHLCLLFRCSC
jgi:hypothetical protein